MALLRGGLAMLAGLGLVAIPYVLYLAWQGTLRTAWQDAIVFPFLHDMQYRGLAVPQWVIRLREYLRPTGNPLGKWLRYYLPLATYASVLGWLVVRFARRSGFSRPNDGQESAGSWTRRETELLVVALLGAFLMVQASGRYDFIHVLPTQIVFGVVFWVAFVGVTGWLWRRARWLSWVPFLLLLYVVPAFILPYQRMLAATQEYRPWKCYSALPQAGCVAIDERAEAAVNYLQQNLPPDEPIYVGTLRHDQILTNDLSVYFLSQRPHASRYQELLPGVATTQAVQETIVRELQEKDVKWVVLVNQKISEEPNLSSTLVGSTYLDEYIREHYQLVANFAKYRVFRRIEDG